MVLNGGPACAKMRRHEQAGDGHDRQPAFQRFVNSCLAQHTSLETRQVRLSVAGNRSASEKPLGRGLIGGLFLDDRGLVSLLARHVRHHELPKLHELLHLLIANLPEHIQRLHLPIRRLGHALKRADDRLLTLHLLALQSGSAECSKRRVERGL